VTVIGPVGVATTVVVVDEDRVEVESVLEIVERVPVDTVGLDVLDELDMLVEMMPFSIYKLSLSGPPQYSRALPVHIISHPLVAGTKLA
jgi:hypothetical protein